MISVYGPEKLSGTEILMINRVFIVFILSFIVHIPLGVYLLQSPEMATIHALLPLAAGLWYACINPKPQVIACIASYLTGAETLWRMCGASVFWEYGKYALIAILVIAVLRTGRFNGRFAVILYFLLLLPSLLIPMYYVGGEDFMKQVSFNLSGPFALMITTWYFSNLEFSDTQKQQVLLALIVPTASLSSIALFDTFSITTIRFSNNSNFITSGGFGPNQVSAALGLAALFCFLAIITTKTSKSLTFLLFFIMVIFATQSAMTFSRGGLYAAGGAAAIAMFFLIKVKRARIWLIASIIAMLLVTDFVILPRLDSFTKGAFTKRFSNVKLTGRYELMMADLQAWSDNPILGTGPGQAKSYRQKFRNNTSAHTEFTRMLGEHGIFGVLAMILLLFVSYRNIMTSRSASEKASTAALIGWSILYMSTAAMRLAAPAFAFGLSALISTQKKKAT